VSLEVGLTGGIGSGKSTVAKMFVDRGCILIDADAIVRQIQEPGKPVFDAIKEQWGEGVVSEDGSLDRAAIAKIVFNSKDDLATLNGIVHPVVVKKIEKLRRRFFETDKIVVLDIPLLLESQNYSLDTIVVVDIEPALAISRLVKYRNFTEADARQRMQNQITSEERCAVASWIIRNNSSVDDLEAEVERCWKWLKRIERPSKKSNINGEEVK
tara:strand:+ start:18 stop:656 length:639 start_codon:yes stop_codon:yes gene_type:complete